MFETLANGLMGVAAFAGMSWGLIKADEAQSFADFITAGWSAWLCALGGAMFMWTAWS